jgi:hypothetical protein
MILMPVSYLLENRRHSFAPVSFISIAIFEGSFWLDWGQRLVLDHLSQIKGGVVPYDGGKAKATTNWKYVLHGYGVQKRTFVGERGEFVANSKVIKVLGFWCVSLHWQRESLVWWSMLSLWYPILLFAILPTLWVARFCHSRVSGYQHNPGLRKNTREKDTVDAHETA